MHPFIGIGRALRARGHDVTILTAEPFRAISEGAGLRFVQIHSQLDFDELTNHPDLWRGTKGLSVLLRAIADLLRAHYAHVESSYEPGRTVLVGHSLSFASRIFEDAQRVPAATVHLAPSIIRSDDQPAASIPGADFSGWPMWLKRSIYRLLDGLLLDPPILPALNQLRREVGLAPVSRAFKSWLHSPQRVIGLFPEWFASVPADWPRQLRLTGFPLYDEAEVHAIDPSLQSFLDAGSAPILFTPGTANRAAAPFFAAALAATRQLKRRALFVTKYPEQLPPDLDDDVRYEPYLPFSRVFSRCAAVVHHGGIGTCAQALAAGIPQLTMPLAFDQPDNTTRVWRLGVARWVRPRDFRADRVASELHALIDDRRIADRCQHWAAQIRKHDALSETCDLLEALIPTGSGQVGAPPGQMRV